MTANKTKVSKGKRVRFRGVVDDESSECVPGRQVQLQSRRPGSNFRNRVLTASDSDGKWVASRRLRKTTEWRVVVQPVGDCEASVSSIVKVKVSRD